MSQPSILPTENLRDLAAMLFDHIEAQINRADTKAGLILAADTLFATTVTALSRGVIVSLFDAGTTLTARVIAGLTIVMFLALLASAVYALVVARPILRLPKRKMTWFFFGRIASANADEFVASFAGQSHQQACEGLLNEIYTISLIANKKFARVQRSFDFLLVALIVWAIIQLVLAMVS